MPNRLVSTTSSACRLLRKVRGRSAITISTGHPALLRMATGPAEWGKLRNIPQVTEFFTSFNIPFSHANAVFVSNLEFFGGILLILGLASRITGLVLTGNMLVAYITADREALGSIFSDPGKFYAADPYTFLFASLIVLIFGAGYLSVDAIVARVVAERTPKVRTPWPTSTSDGATARV